MRTLSRAPRIVAITRATRPEPPLRTTVGASTTATSNRSGARLNTNSRSELEWKRSVEATMITPSRTSATMLSTVCETSVPSSTGNVSRMRPVRRESTIARAGSPRRAGRVADISTPTIVAEATSRRRSGAAAAPARAIANHEMARRNIEAIISAVAIRTQLDVGADDAGHDPVDADPLRGDQGQADAEHARDAEPDPPRDPVAATGARRGRVERRQPLGGDARAAVDRRERRPGARAARARSRARRRARPLVDALDGLGDARPGVALRRLAGCDRPCGSSRSGSRLSPCSSSARRCGSAGGTSMPSWPSLTTSA